MTLTPLAVQADVEAIIGRSLNATQTTACARLLDMASGVVRRYTRQNITQVVNDVVTLPGNWGNTLELPERPVTAVASVSMNGATMANTMWKLVDNSLFLGTGAFMPDYGSTIWGGSALWGPAGSNQGPQAIGNTWQGPTAQVTVTYTHGYADVPQDIVNIVAGMVALQINAETGIQSEMIGDYKVVYARNGNGGMALSDDDKSALNYYRKRATSSSVDVVR
jgi:hypothetical protein